MVVITKKILLKLSIERSKITPRLVLCAGFEPPTFLHSTAGVQASIFTLVSLWPCGKERHLDTAATAGGARRLWELGLILINSHLTPGKQRPIPQGLPQLESKEWQPIGPTKPSSSATSAHSLVLWELHPFS